MGVQITPPTTADQRSISARAVPAVKTQVPPHPNRNHRWPTWKIADHTINGSDENAERDRLIVQQFVERLHGCYRQWRKLPSSPSQPIRLAFLVERDRVTAFQSRVENACKTCQEGRCVVLGPWPPYSFV